MNLYISYLDRIGIVHDITLILANHKINILSIEAEEGMVFLKYQPTFEEKNLQIMHELSHVRNVKKVERTSYKPSNERVEQLAPSRPITFSDIPFASKIMAQVLIRARRYATSDSTILIRGETGTGKELFARSLHSASARANAAFVPINCAAIPDTLLESELFGYEEGTFTGALKVGKPGLFELANGGTLFLDEIGEIPIHLQVKLLRVLQEQRVRRIGGNKEISIDVRIIAATNQNLETMMAGQIFRKDLYSRLNVIPLLIPPLRERFEDIRLLSELFLKQFASKLQRPVKGFSSSAMERLETYNWPGNVRELKNIIERAVNLVDGIEIRSEHILLDLLPQSPVALPAVQFETYQTLEERLGEMERVILQETARRFGSSRSMGAVLGLSHTAVLKKMRKYKLSLYFVFWNFLITMERLVEI